MMKLSVMKAVSATCDAEWRSPLAEQIAARWEYDAGSCRAVWFSSNFVFRFTQGGQARILRFVRSDERTRAAIEAEMAFVEHLRARGIWAPEAFPSRAGAIVETVETGLGEFHAVAMEALPGEGRETEDLTPAMFRDWGRLTGELHNAAQGYAHPGRPDWRAQLDQAEDALPETEGVARAAARLLKERLGAMPVSAVNFGLIHYDLSPDNVRWGGERLGLIDFDDCAHYWFAADVAYALRELYEDRASRLDLNHPRLLDFVAGYREVRTLDDADLGGLRLFAAANHLIKLAELRAIVEEGHEPDEPEWAAGLRVKLAGMLEGYRAEMQALLDRGGE